MFRILDKKNLVNGFVNNAITINIKKIFKRNEIEAPLDEAILIGFFSLKLTNIPPIPKLIIKIAIDEKVVIIEVNRVITNPKL